jgi:predicted acetyltransferase
MRPEQAAEDLSEIKQDAPAYLAKLDGTAPNPAPVRLPDGSSVPRLPGFVRWMWDGQFAGSINFRYQKGTAALPAYVLGHVGYTTVPWKAGNGYATAALRSLLVEIGTSTDLAHIELTTDIDNTASQRVIQHNGGVLIETFVSPMYGPQDKHRWRIDIVR